MHNKSTVCRGDVWVINLEPHIGSEMNKARPCLVVTNNTANKYARIITVAALTSTPPKQPYPFIVEVPDSANMPRASWIHCSHIRSVDSARLVRYITSLDSTTMSKVDAALAVQLDLNGKRFKS